MVAETQPPAHEEVAAPVEDVAEAEESVNAEPAKTYRPLFGASLEDLLSMLVGLAAGCFCLYLGLYSPMLSVTRMQKMKMPQDIQWDERNVCKYNIITGNLIDDNDKKKPPVDIF